MAAKRKAANPTAASSSDPVRRAQEPEARSGRVVGAGRSDFPGPRLVSGQILPHHICRSATQGHRPHKGIVAGFSTGALFEFDFQYEGKTVKQFTSAGPHGGTVTIVIPCYRLVGKTTPADPAFLNELTDVLAYAKARAESLERLPWAKWPLPKKFVMVETVSGYGVGIGYGVRFTDRAVLWAELQMARQLGINALREPEGFLLTMLAEHAGTPGLCGRHGNGAERRISGRTLPEASSPQRLCG